MKKIVCIRHGQSTWNLENKFTGWVDVELSENGLKEAKEAGQILKDAGFNFDHLFTSHLKRAIHTADIITEVMGQRPKTTRSWRLNERHYGALQGKNKAETAKEFGDAQVKIWRRSYDTPPPQLESVEAIPSHWDESGIPQVLSESLKDTVLRVTPYWEEVIKPAFMNGESILIAAHGNSLRGLLKHLFQISDNDIVGLEIATGTPLVLNFDDNFNPIEFKPLL